MKAKLIFILVTLFYSTFLFSQSTLELDKANGFKSFILETDLSLYYQHLIYKGIVDGVKSYEYSNPNSIEFQRNKPVSATFDFYNNKLYDIMLFIKDYDMMGYNRVIKELIILFGEPTENRKTLTGQLWITWEGKNVSLMTQYFYEDDSFCIEFQSKNIKRKILQKKF